MEAYLDNSATTRVSEDVKDIMVKVMTEEYGNPSSLHMKGVEAEHYVREAREKIAILLCHNFNHYIFKDRKSVV